MKILNLNVKQQKLFYEMPDFIVEGSREYLYLKFNFLSNDWNDCDMIVAIFEDNDKKITKEVLDNDNKVKVDKKILVGGAFNVSLSGYNNIIEQLITTNSISIPINYTIKSEDNYKSTYDKIEDSIVDADLTSSFELTFTKNSGDKIILRLSSSGGGGTSDVTFVSIEENKTSGYIRAEFLDLIKSSPDVKILQGERMFNYNGDNGQVRLYLTLQDNVAYVIEVNLMDGFWKRVDNKYALQEELTLGLSGVVPRRLVEIPNVNLGNSNTNDKYIYVDNNGEDGKISIKELLRRVLRTVDNTPEDINEDEYILKIIKGDN